MSQASEIERAGGESLAIKCDVLDFGAQASLFDAHIQRHRGLHIVCLNAGVLERGRPPILSHYLVPNSSSTTDCGQLAILLLLGLAQHLYWQSIFASVVKPRLRHFPTFSKGSPLWSQGA